MGGVPEEQGGGAQLDGEETLIQQPVAGIVQYVSVGSHEHNQEKSYDGEGGLEQVSIWPHYMENEVQLVMTVEQIREAELALLLTEFHP